MATASACFVKKRRHEIRNSGGCEYTDSYKDWRFYGTHIYIRNLSNQVILVRHSELSAEDHAWLVDLLTRHLGAALA